MKRFFSFEKLHRRQVLFDFHHFSTSVIFVACSFDATDFVFANCCLEDHQARWE